MSPAGTKERFRAQVERGDAFPRAQLFVLAICRLCEPIAFMSVFPYIYYMVKSFNGTQDDKQITFYAGLVTSAFAFAEGVSSTLWGSLSDRVGRKPVLLTGLAGTGLSMLMLGFSTSLPVAITARFLGGLLNGNIGVIQTTVAEVVRVESHQPRAYSVLPFVWSLGAIIGSGLGGALADPVIHYPAWFAPGTIFDRYPYLLPNLICALVSLMSFTVGLLFLEETHEDKVNRRDYGREVGTWLLNWGRTPSVMLQEEKFDRVEETLGFLADGQPLGFPSARTSLSSSDASVYSCHDRKPQLLKKSHRGKVFTSQVLLCFLGYGILAFHTICIETLLPMLYEMPKSQTAPRFPFLFSGGFGFSTKTVGGIISAQGFISMIVQIFVYPAVSRRLGSTLLFRLTCSAYPLFYFLVPYIILLPERLGYVGILAVMITKVTLGAFLVPSIQIIIARSAPSKKMLGTVNGYAASVATLLRGLGSIISGLIQDQGLKVNCTGLAWWFLSCIALLGFLESLYLAGDRTRETSSTIANGSGDEEALLPDHFVDDPTSPILGETGSKPPSWLIERRTSYGSLDEPVRT